MDIIKDIRDVQRLVGEEWIDIEFSVLSKGDFFRMYESDGMPVIDKECFTIFTATSNAYMNKEGIWEVETEN